MKQLLHDILTFHWNYVDKISLLWYNSIIVISTVRFITSNTCSFHNVTSMYSYTYVAVSTPFLYFQRIALYYTLSIWGVRLYSQDTQTNDPIINWRIPPTTPPKKTYKQAIQNRPDRTKLKSLYVKPMIKNVVSKLVNTRIIEVQFNCDKGIELQTLSWYLVVSKLI